MFLPPCRLRTALISRTLNSAVPLLVKVALHCLLASFLTLLSAQPLLPSSVAQFHFLGCLQGGCAHLPSSLDPGSDGSMTSSHVCSRASSLQSTSPIPRQPKSPLFTSASRGSAFPEDIRNHTDGPATLLQHFRWAQPSAWDCGVDLCCGPCCLLQNVTVELAPDRQTLRTSGILALPRH